MRPEHIAFWSRRALLMALPATAIAATPVPSVAPAWPVLQQLHGRVVLVDFWASWCVPCRRSFPWMNDLQRRFGDRMAIVAVNLDQERSLADAFLREWPAAFRLEFDAAGVVARQFGVRAMPTSFLIDHHGRVRARHAGFRDAQRAEREQQIVQLMEEST